MPEWISQSLSEINIPQLIAIGIMLWYGYNRLDAKIKEEIKEVKSDIKNLSDKVASLDKSVACLEVEVRSKGGCELNHQEHRKAL